MKKLGPSVLALSLLVTTAMPAAQAGLLDMLQKNATKSWDSVKDQVKEAGHEVWTGLKTLDCGKIVEGMSKLNIANLIVGAIAKPAGTCLTKFQEGFLSSLPDMLKGLADVVIGSAKAGWANKSTCLKMGPLFSTCGLYYSAKAKFEKIGACFKAMGTKEILKLLWEEAWKLGCKVAGELVADATLEALSAGSGTPAVVAKWILKVHHLLAPATWLKIHKAAKAVNTAIDYAKDVAKGLAECK